MLKTKTCTPVIYDQTNDRSGAEFTKIARRLDDGVFASNAINTLFGLKRNASTEKTASFPCGSKEDVIVSRVYFEGQREKIASDKAAEIDARIARYEALFDISIPVTFKAIEKTASAKEHVLIASTNCKVASESELVQAGEDFSYCYRDLTSAQRMEFAESFVKTAHELNHEELPADVRVYTGIGVKQNPSLKDNILLRKVAMERVGDYNSGYKGLYEQIVDCDTSSYSIQDLQKLASALDYADRAYELHERKHARTIPDAWHSVFMAKTADELNASNSNLKSTEQLTKADIISRYGSGILEDIEGVDGKIDHERLAKVVSALGGAKNDISASGD